MLIQRTSAYYPATTNKLSATPRPSSAESLQQASTISTTSFADSVRISQTARDLLASHSRPTTVAESNATAEFDTNQGSVALDIDAYFSPPGSLGVDLNKVPLLMPNQKNIYALTQHISARMPDFLANNGIASPPASITYDNMGQIKLPADYPYADAFKQALTNNPAMERELRTNAALASQMVEINKSLPFQQEYAAATSPSEINAIVAKYSYLFSDNKHYDTISLNFTTDSTLAITHDDKPLSQL